jgi:phosphatidylserine/phosphatidylglycerophosphate/cardiolipin synthase-like enzyme
MLNRLLHWLGLTARPHDPFNYRSIAYKSKDISVIFSPQGGCTEAIVQEIVQAKQEILVLAYAFTSQDIASAMLAAHDRGVNVQVIVDANEGLCRGNQVDALKKEIKVYKDAYHVIAHNKIILIDKSTVITGSFNYTSSAEHVNGENLLIIRNSPVCAAYLANFNAHLAHSIFA